MRLALISTEFLLFEVDKLSMQTPSPSEPAKYRPFYREALVGVKWILTA